MTALQEIITAIQALINFFKFKETEILKTFQERLDILTSESIGSDSLD